ncbi:MAG: hypothetical protein PQJ58_16045, partial [Spirochaetales bacterium]|nr:hypothetical protein [Spirochaetales bacterium]
NALISTRVDEIEALKEELKQVPIMGSTDSDSGVYEFGKYIPGHSSFNILWNHSPFVFLYKKKGS